MTERYSPSKLLSLDFDEFSLSPSQNLPDFSQSSSYLKASDHYWLTCVNERFPKAFLKKGHCLEGIQIKGRIQKNIFMGSRVDEAMATLWPLPFFLGSSKATFCRSFLDELHAAIDNSLTTMTIGGESGGDIHPTKLLGM
jgi:hypothetical protein